MEPTAHTAHTELDAVRIRRAELGEAMDHLDEALAAPAPGRAAIWGEAVQAVLAVMVEDFGEHIDVTEGPGGLHQAILAGDLRLANAVDALTAEHALIAREIADLVAETESPVTPQDVDAARDRGTSLLSRLRRHRQRGADLIYEAYHTDIGGTE